ncbi:MAG: hypothetical protein ABI396_00800, partial [Ktedonobacteraceae bacterium]
ESGQVRAQRRRAEATPSPCPRLNDVGYLTVIYLLPDALTHSFSYNGRLRKTSPHSQIAGSL